GDLPTDPRGQRRHLKAKLLENRGEQRVLFEAVATAAIPNQLLLDRGEVQPDRHAPNDIEVFERNRSGVQRLEGPQHGEREFARSCVADTREVRVEVQLCHAAKLKG